MCVPGTGVGDNEGDQGTEGQIFPSCLRRAPAMEKAITFTDTSIKLINFYDLECVRSQNNEPLLSC